MLQSTTFAGANHAERHDRSSHNERVERELHELHTADATRRLEQMLKSDPTKMVYTQAAKHKRVPGA